MEESGDIPVESVLVCESANRLSDEFYRELKLYETGSVKWFQFVRERCECENDIQRVLAFRVFADSQDSRWLEYLFERTKVEKSATTLCAIFWAIGSLKGFNSPSDYNTFFESSDVSCRCAAIQIVHFLPRDSAVKILIKILHHDQSPFLKKTAAKRLAYLNSSEGMHLLLESLHQEPFFEQLESACALSVLNNSVGLKFLSEVLQRSSDLTRQERTDLLFSVTGLFSEIGVELEFPEAKENLPVGLIFGKAFDWIEKKLEAVE